MSRARNIFMVVVCLFSSIFGMDFQKHTLVRYMLETASADVTYQACLKALDMNQSEIASYVGQTFIGNNWESCRQYCDERSAQGPAPEAVKEVFTRMKKDILQVCIQVADKNNRQDVVSFLQDNRSHFE